MRILGISAYYHDSAAALVVDGEIIAAAQEERFTRKKHDSSFPRSAVRYCLSEAGIDASGIDRVVFYDKPFLKFERLLETYLAFAPRGFKSFRTAIPVWLKEKLFQRNLLAEEMTAAFPDIDWGKRLLFCEHHQSHAASAFFASPFEEAAVLTLDGVGEWATASVAHGHGNALEIIRDLHWPHSLGLLYSAFTYHAGFKVNSGEYKLMGLAPYGEPRFRNRIISELMDLKPDGSFRLKLDYFGYCTGLTMTSPRFERLFESKARRPDELLTQHHMDLAASIQAVTEEIMLRMTRSIAKQTGLRNLCLAGGVALNCVANGKVLRDGQFDNIWIQPAAGDAGGAIGAALAAYHLFENRPRTSNRTDAMKGAFLGPSFTQAEAAQRLTESGARYHVLDDDALFHRTAAALVDEKAVGWFQGRMEFGPRALGGRSILADPRSPAMQKVLNLKIKFRESFRPFAPSVLREDAPDWFELETESPYMLIVADVREHLRREMTAQESALFGIDRLNIMRSDIPAVTHVDYSARIQTVSRDTNPRYHRLLTSFKQLTGCPVLVNTSFNVRGEPIVCAPEDAFRCFMGNELDLLVCENCLLLKEEQDPNLKLDYQSAFDPD